MAGPPPTSPEQGLSLWKAEPAPGCGFALRNSEQGWKHACDPRAGVRHPNLEKGALGFTPTQMFFSSTEHFNRSLLRIFLHRQRALS